MTRHRSSAAQMIQSVPLKVEWCGWQSDTARLQRAGWDISAYERPDTMSLGVAMRYNTHGRTYAVGHLEMREFEFDRLMYGGFDRFRRPWDDHPFTRMTHPVMMNMAGNIRFQVMMPDTVQWHAVDAQPHMLEYEEKDLEDWAVFRKLPSTQKAPEIIIPELSFDDALNHLLKLQGPKQAELRDRALKERWREGMKISKYDMLPDVGATLRVA